MSLSKIYSRKTKALWNFLISQTCAFLMAVSAIIIGYYQFYISRPILKYTSQTTALSSSADTDTVKIHIRGKEYPKVYKTTLTLLNSGQDALDGKNVSSIGHDPIRIPLETIDNILHYEINPQKTSSDVSAHLIKTPKALVIKFNYLNPDNQIAIDIYNSDNTSNYIITGSAINVNHIKQAWSSKKTRNYIILFIFGIILFYALFIYLYVRRHKPLPHI